MWMSSTPRSGIALPAVGLPHHRFLPDELDLEESGQDASALLASIVRDSNDAIISKTLDGRITSWNQGAQQLFGYSADEAIGQLITLIIPEDRQAEEEFILKRLRAGERLEHFETVRKRKDGAPVEVSLTVSPMRNREGRIVGASKIARDIGDRKRYEQALQEMDRRKDEFLAILSHELRSPLSPLLNAAELLKARKRDSLSLDWLSGVLERQVRQMSRLVNDLLDLSRINAGKIALNLQPLPIGDAIERAVNESRWLVDRMGHSLQVVPPAEPLLVHGDSDRLVQVITNLLNNAAKYTNAGGDIWLTAERDRDQVLLKVRDTGIGIAPEKLEAIFDLYAQTAEAQVHSHGGLGIGLTVVRRLVEMHGGSIQASSPGPGCGSEFAVRLPLQAGPSSLKAAAPRAKTAGACRVLIADDNEDAAMTLAALLRDSGHEVIAVNDGVAALAAAGTFKPDVAMLDLRLPKLSGEDLARKLRADLGDDVLLVALTGFGQERDRVASRNAGFDRHLVKPVDLAELEELIDSRKC